MKTKDEIYKVGVIDNGIKIVDDIKQSDKSNKSDGLITIPSWLFKLNNISFEIISLNERDKLKDCDMIFAILPYVSGRNEALYEYQNISKCAKDKCVFISSKSVLYRQSSEEEGFRNNIILQNTLSTVIQLRESIFNNISTPFIIILDNNKKDNKARFYNLNEKNTSTDEEYINEIKSLLFDLPSDRTFFTEKDLSEVNKGNLLPSYYQSLENENYKYYLQTFNTIEVRNISTTFKSRYFKDSILKDSESSTIFKEIYLSDIPLSGYVSSHTREIVISEADKISDKYIIKPLDILVSVSGVTGKVGIIPEDISNNFIACQYMQIIRLFDKNLAIPMYMFLKSETGQLILESLVIGSGQKQISNEDIKEMKVPIFNNKQIKYAKDQFIHEIEMYSEIQKLHEKIKSISKNFITYLGGLE